MKIGIGISLAFEQQLAVGGGAPPVETILDPLVEWNGDDTTSLPVLLFGLYGAKIGDTLTLERSQTSGLTSGVQSAQVTIDAGNIGASSFPFDFGGGWPNATWYVRLTHSRAGAEPGVSDIVQVDVAVSTINVLSDLFDDGSGGLWRGMWLDASDPSVMFSDAGVTPVVNGIEIQEFHDKSGHGHILSQATLAARPKWNSAGYLTWGNRYLFANIDLFPDINLQQYTVFALLDSTSGINTNLPLICLCTTASAQPRKDLIVAKTATNNLGTYDWPDASGARYNAGFLAGAFTGAKQIIGMVDNGTHYIPYLGNVAQPAVSHSDAGTFNNFTRVVLGCVSNNGAFSNYWSNRPVYQVFLIEGALNQTQIDKLVELMGAY